MIEVPVLRYFSIGKIHKLARAQLREYHLDEKPQYPYVEDRVYRSKEVKWNVEYEDRLFNRIILSHDDKAVFLIEGSYDPIFHSHLTYNVSFLYDTS